MIKQFNDDIKVLEKQIRELEKKKATLIKERENYSRAKLRIGTKVRIIRDEWDSWGPSPGSIQYVHELDAGHLFVGAKNKKSGSFWTSYDNVVVVED